MSRGSGRRWRATALLMWLAVGMTAADADPLRVLFVGNSFFYGALSDVERYRVQSVRDLNGTGYGGVPAVFRRLADESGLELTVAQETIPGAGFDEHFEHHRDQIDTAWDVVIMSTYSTLDRDHPGNPAALVHYTPLFARLFAARNPAVRLYLNATWSRADQVWQPQGHWYGQPVSRMAEDVQEGYEAAKGAEPRVRGVIPTGRAWNRAMREGIALDNPYLAPSAGRIDLWATDHYHASNAGYYLQALVIFTAVTGRDPRRFGAGEAAAVELGLPAELTVQLQNVAWAEVTASADQ